MLRGEAPVTHGMRAQRWLSRLTDRTFAALLPITRLSQRAPQVQSNARIVIIGGGSAGITVAARLCRRLAQPNVILIEPSSQHVYQPGQTLVGGGVLRCTDIIRAEHAYVPHGTIWLQDMVMAIDPERHTLHTRGGQTVQYDYLVVASGLQLHYDHIPGLAERLGSDDRFPCDALNGVGKFTTAVPPDAVPLSLAGAGALAVNLAGAFMLVRYRAHRGSLIRAAKA